jgi:hypothetical protein
MSTPAINTIIKMMENLPEDAQDKVVAFLVGRGWTRISLNFCFFTRTRRKSFNVRTIYG